MKNTQVKLIIYTAMIGIFCQLLGCDKPTADFVRPDYTPPRFSNPVAGPSLTNPSVLRTWDGWFYAYGSEVTDAEAGGAALIPVMKSADLVNWTFQRAAFASRPSWHQGLLSSPEVVEVDRQAYMYYSFGDIDDPEVSIGIATAFNPAGPYVNREDLEEMGDKPGNLLDADSIHIADPRHPFFFQDGEGPKYLLWTSSNAADQSGVYGLPLTENGLRVPDWEATEKIASGTLKGVVIHQIGAEYYLFGTKEEGGTSRIVVGRSDRLQGPYVDKNGTDMNDDAAGSTFIDGSAIFVNPGHNTRIFTDKNAEDWILFHAIDTRESVSDNGPENRSLVLAKVVWNNGWPEIVADYLSAEEVTGPNFY